MRPEGLADHVVADLPRLLRAGDVLVFNDTRVIPAQLEGRRGEARIGATLHKREGPRDWRAFVRNAKRVRDGDRIDFGGGVCAIARDKAADGSILLSFEGEEPVELLLERAGRMPLPPYIAGRRDADARDAEDYQTMFAREAGAVAAPTAALHFTPRLVEALGAAGIGHRDAHPPCRRRHLPAGQGRRHRRPCHAQRMGPDRRRGGRAAQCGAGRGRARDRRSAPPRSACSKAPPARTGASARSRATPPSSSRRATASAAIDGLLTNFHLPRSTLFMLVSALMGLETMQAAYAHAIEAGYRFYSYGDASLLLPG